MSERVQRASERASASERTTMPDARDRGAMMRWVWRGTALVVLLIGWAFIAWQNHFHITAPLVFVCLGYLAVVATVYNLWRTGAAAVASAEDEDDSTWAKPAGVRGELEREKRTLLKAIKEAEFDHQMGKLSQRDADDMIRTYRARAIDVLKDLERLELGSAGSAREQILREVRARIEVEARSHKKAAAEPRQGAKPDGSNAEAAKGQNRNNRPLAQEGATPTEPTTTAAGATGTGATGTGAATTASPAPDDAAPQTTEVAEAPHPAQAAARADLDDEAMNADSTTAVEPMRGNAAKEATP